MWGAPGSGKTAFLASLHIALTEAANGWLLVGRDGPSVTSLQRMIQDLTTNRRFPEATTNLDEFRWRLVGTPKKRRWWNLFSKQDPVPQRIGLDVLDPPGEAFNLDSPEYAQFQRKLVDQLEKSQAIVYMYDPVHDNERGDAFRYFFSPLTELAKRMLGGDDPLARLPHHVAVCITKFDDPRVLESAQTGGYVVLDSEFGFPTVGEDDARDLFQDLCSVAVGGDAHLVLANLGQFFHPDRVRYYVTSSVGFYLDESGMFNPDDYQNVLPQVDSQPLIRGRVHPINVREPLQWLGSKIISERHG